VEEPNDVELVIALARTGGVDAGDYAVAVAGERTAKVHLKLTDRVCGSRRDSVARQGTVHVDEFEVAAAFAQASGTYQLVFDDGELKGSFAAAGCEVAADQDFDQPDCDDVDHDGEPGGESSGGGGDGDD